MSYADYDPEDEHHVPSHNEDSEDAESDQGDGREHYEAVGSSKLRQKDEPDIGAKYEGVAVSRTRRDDDEIDPFAPVDEDENEDPFAVVPSRRSDGSLADSESAMACNLLVMLVSKVSMPTN